MLSHGVTIHSIIEKKFCINKETEIEQLKKRNEEVGLMIYSPEHFAESAEEKLCVIRLLGDIPSLIIK